MLVVDVKGSGKTDKQCRTSDPSLPAIGDLISEATLAVEMGVTTTDLAMTIHPHPTLSETLMEAAARSFDRSIHIGPSR
jgi:hypothetical protein